MTPTVAPAADSPLTLSAIDTLLRLSLAGDAGAPASKLPARDLGPLADRGFVTQADGRDTITAAGVAFLDAHRQPDGTHQFGEFVIGPLLAPAAAAK